mgnify:CR=1 FL=1
MNAAFFLKASVPKDLPPGTKGVALDPTEYGFACSGADKLCSTAYSQLWQHLGPGAVKKLRAKYGIAGRVAFVGFSAAHGFLNPLLASDADRADISTVILLDATFGGGKDGYVKAAKDAAAGKLQLVSVTSDKGSSDALNNGDYAWREFVLKPAGLILTPTSPVPPMPAPGGGVSRVGDLWYYRYKDSEVHHWDLGKLLGPVVKAHLWRGASAGKTRWGLVVSPLGLVAGGVYFYTVRKRAIAQQEEAA